MPFFSRNLKTVYFLPVPYIKTYLSLGIISLRKKGDLSFIIYKQIKLGISEVHICFSEAIL